MRSLPRRTVTAIACVSLVASLAACKETFARIDDDATIELSAAACPEAMLTVGDSLHFTAEMISKRQGDMAGNPDTLYRSHESPRSFRWSVNDSSPETGENAVITPSGVLTGRTAGIVYVTARSAGKLSDRFGVEILPRVTRFAITPHDTSVQVGDTIILRANVALEGRRSVRSEFDWGLGPNGWRGRRIQPVERDPDVPPSYDHSDERRVVAVTPGTERLFTCLGGVRRDTVTVRITGELPVVNRDVPPKLRLAPAETTVYVGATFSPRVRILNSGLGNGPYTLRASAGDGTVATDLTSTGRFSRSFGDEYHVFIDHRYFTPGSFAFEVTATDSAGRSATLRTTYTAILPVFSLVVNPFEPAKAIRLNDKDPYLQVAILSDDRHPYTAATSIYGPAMAEEYGLPPVRFGRTIIPQAVSRRNEARDANGDGVTDLVMYLDRAALIRNGDLRLGANELVMSAGTTVTTLRLPGKPLPVRFATPVSGVARFTVVP